MKRIIEINDDFFSEPKYELKKITRLDCGNKYLPENELLKEATRGNIECIDFWLDLGADINVKDKQDCTPLLLASSEGHSSVVEFLIQKGADINIRDEGGWDPITAASFYGHLDVVKILKEKAKTLTDDPRECWSPLTAACYNGHIEIAKYLISECANVNFIGAKNMTALSAAAVNHHTNVIKLLLASGVDTEPPSFSDQVIQDILGHRDNSSNVIADSANDSKPESSIATNNISSETEQSLPSVLLGDDCLLNDFV